MIEKDIKKLYLASKFDFNQQTAYRVLTGTKKYKFDSLFVLDVLI